MISTGRIQRRRNHRCSTSITELCTTHHLRDDSFAAARAVFGDAALTELLMIVSCYYGLALVLNAADLDIDTTARFQV